MSASLRIVGLLLLVLLTGSSLAAQGFKKDPPENCVGINPQAPIRLEVFSDFQCPHCRQFYLEVVRPLLADYAMKGKVCVIYHEFPLRHFKYSRQAARYAKAAARLGQEKWIEVSSALFYYQSQWVNDGQLEPVVAKVLPEKEMKQVNEWLNDPALEAAIERDVESGRARDVRATPTIFITANGKTERVPSGVQYPILRRYIDFQLAPQ